MTPANVRAVNDHMAVCTICGVRLAVGPLALPLLAARHMAESHRTAATAPPQVAAPGRTASADTGG